MTQLKKWVTECERRLKPTDLKFLDHQICTLLETSPEIEKKVFKWPLCVILVKFSDKVEFALVDTSDPETLEAITGRLEDWYDAYGIRAYSLKQAYDRQGFLVSAIDGATYTPTDRPIPELSDQWEQDAPLSMQQLPVEVFHVQ